MGAVGESGAAPSPHGASWCLSPQRGRDRAAVPTALTHLVSELRGRVFLITLPGGSWGIPYKPDPNAGQMAPLSAGMIRGWSFSTARYLGNGAGRNLVPRSFDRNSNLSCRLPCLDTNSYNSAINQASQVPPSDEMCFQ